MIPNPPKIIYYKLITKYLLVYIFVTSCSVETKSQIKEDVKFAKALFADNDSVKSRAYTKLDNPNELQMLAYGSFAFYKYFFSSQDGNRCVFHPSCSSYTLQSIQKHGFLLGLLYGVDRLQRCNKLSATNYENYKNTNLFSDPVD